jgi:hypothetical protein
MLEAIIGAVVGAALLLYPSNVGRHMTDRHSQRIAEIDAGAPEAHFEELGELKAYPPVSGPAALRGVGAGLLILSLALLAYQQL